MNESHQKLCDCVCCTNLLNLGNTGRLEIWYGSGSNGKTTLLSALAQKLGTENCLTISTQDYSGRWLSRVKDTTKLICVQEVLEDDNGRFVRFLEGNLKPNVRYIMTTNVIYPWMERSRICRITSFPHRFPEPLLTHLNSYLGS